MSNFYTEDHLVEQPAIQLMQHELGWDVVNCYGEWSGGVSNQGRDGKREGGNIEHRTSNIEHRSGEKWKRRKNLVIQRLNPDLPVEAIAGSGGGRLGARRSGIGLRRDATATFCWTIGSICALWDSDIPCNWNP